MPTINGTSRLAVAVPKLEVGNVAANVASTLELARRAAAQGAAIVVFPELGLTGYTLGDLVQQPLVLNEALGGLRELAAATADLTAALVVGLPLLAGDQLYNVAAVLAGGKIMGLVPKSYLPNYQEFYEARWYRPADELVTTEVRLGDALVPIGTDLLFEFSRIPGLTLGIEICEDLWAPMPPSTMLAPLGATVIANLSASNELAGKADYRRQLVVGQSARLRAAYLYASAGVGESTTDVIFSGHGIIAENGLLLGETERFSRVGQLTMRDIDLDHLAFDRRRAGTYKLPQHLATAMLRRIRLDVKPPRPNDIMRRLDRSPFVPAAGPQRDARTEEIFNLQSAALASRLEQSGISEIVLGVSGGLDSTLALLVGIRALSELGLPLTNMHCLTMPGMATSDRTKSNAHTLARALGVPIEEVPIKAGSMAQLGELGHDGTDQDVTYQNAQARYRTSLLMGRANQIHGLVLGTGDLSEIALGWATFNGDHISHYHVNAGVPKTLVKHLVSWAAEQPEFAPARAALLDIVDTPVSPELAATKAGELDQATEDIIGPYELTDFFLYHFMRWGEAPQKLFALARATFDDYSDAELKKWLQSFLARFFGAQWKRSVMPDGPKIGSVSLSPRGDWRMPSAIDATMWTSEVQ